MEFKGMMNSFFLAYLHLYLHQMIQIRNHIFQDFHHKFPWIYH